MDRTQLLNKLWEFQHRLGYISKESISTLSKKLNVSTVEIESVVSFYHFFHKKPTGKHTIYLNNSIISDLKGFEDVKATFEKETGCSFGEYGNKEFSLFETSCIGMSDQEPAALINFQPFTDLTPSKVRNIIQKIKNGENVKDFSSKTISKIHYTPDDDKTVIFRNYELGKSVKEGLKFTPQEIIDKIYKSKLKGCGGAFFDVGYKWQSCKRNEDTEKYIICNADEGEPGTFKDRAIFQHLPGLVIEGMILAGYATGAKEGIIYLRAEYQYFKQKLEDLIQEFYTQNLLGKNIQSIDGFDFEIRIQLGAGSYVCGAASALIESMQGRRGEPPVRMWSATKHGFKHKPTVVNNVESLAYASRIIELGEDYFLSMGTKETPGTKLISISGDVAKAGIYEIEYGTSIRELLGIEMAQATAPYYVQVSGPSGECVSPAEFDRKICMEDILCGGSFMVFNRTRDILHILRNFMEFFKEESCGVCTPCRAGNFILNEKVKKMQRGLASQDDVDEIKKWGKIIKLSSRCGLGKSSPNSLIFSIDKFKDYYNLKIAPSNEFQNVEFDMEAAIHEFDSIIKDTQL
ncbi:NAD(P)-dependent nickel-iron dehydrogenase flavin-containing subunit [Lutibacter oricola]|uniref:NAD(P)-dependent nickel-iron dehydrogenase flavin-containing subunit n=1 Tax=Lutibacter oricola TaxID=762486 RepID=A0A1H3EW96_9FLAO|nr:NAD(P)H-dependent oxidoreductase subunit E [Lutibacter oricola]SDX82199.1 NAD(P)-dependent nickel-iron dehydrogenase flavin-containing subunit [Lutibacter oricola]